MATALIAHGISRIVCQEPLYKALAERFVRRMAQQESDWDKGSVVANIERSLNDLVRRYEFDRVFFR